MTDAALDMTIAAGASRGLWGEAARRFLNHRLATLGLIMLAIIVLACVLAPPIAHYGPIGCVAGYFGGKVDLLLMGLIDMVLTFPRLVIIIAFVAVVGPSIFNTMVVIGLLSWPSIARLTRGEILALRNQEFILAARSLGTSPPVIILEHILPNMLSPILVAITLDVATVILLEASLSFLGLGAQAPAASWGNMLRDARTLSILESQPWMWIPPGAMIAMA
ncbi:MAG: ABC transporter permease, partial [Mesorhizobium sp.]